MQKIICPFHSEKTASLVVYEASFKCFGCGRSGPNTALFHGTLPTNVPVILPVPENLSRSLEAIRRLDVVNFRGFDLNRDSGAVYLVWPGNTFYKKRLLQGEPKYKCPSGHKVPLFVARARGRAIVVIEGEFNAMSVAKCCPDLAVVSPGGSNHFESDYTMLNHLTRVLSFNKVLVVADKDPAGAKAIAGFYKQLKIRGRECVTLLMDKDANQVMLEDGEDKLREIIEGALDQTVDGSVEDRGLPQGL